LSVRLLVFLSALAVSSAAPALAQFGPPPVSGPDAGAPAEGGTDASAQAADAGATDGGAPDAGATDAARAPSTDAAGAPAPTRLAPAVPAAALLHGTVLARGGHRRVKAASVFVDGEPVAETDAAGAFAVLTAPGHHRLQVVASGHQAADIPVDLPAIGREIVVRLTPGGQVFETVVAAKPVTAAVRVEAEEARTTAGTGGDPFRVIESLPGVSQIVWPFALYAIRGANPGNTGFFLDGMRVPALFHFALGPSIVHPYLIDKLSFYPGGYPARLGGYISGAVAADTAAPPHDVTRYSADVRLYDAGGLVAAPWNGGKGTVAVAARYAYTGLIVSRLFGNVDFGYADYQLRADHPLAGGRATLLALGSFDYLDIKDQSIGDASLNYHRVDLRWDRPLGGGTFFVRTAFGTDAAKSQLYESPIKVRGYGVSPRLAYSHPIGRAQLEVGADAEAQHFDADVTFATGPTLPGAMPMPPPMLLADLARDRNALSVRGYVAAAIPIARLSLEPGLRYAQYFEQGVTRGALEPRLTARLAIMPRLSVDATVGRFSQMPSLPVGVAGFEAFGLADFGLQWSTQAALGVEGRLPADLTLRLTGYHQWLQVTDMRSTFAHDVTTPEFLQMRNGRAYGAELLLRLPDRARLRGWLAYTLSWSLREFDGVYAPSDWDQRHILNLVSGYRVGRGWSVGGRFHYNTGRPYPVDGEYQRLPAFWQIDLRADKRVVFDRSTWDFYMDLGNLTLNQQVTGLGVMLGDMTGKVQPVGYRIVLPSIGVHVEW
jgi:hypothetical protein